MESVRTRMGKVFTFSLAGPIHAINPLKSAGCCSRRLTAGKHAHRVDRKIHGQTNRMLLRSLSLQPLLAHFTP
jgi:hypothetical protein